MAAATKVHRSLAGTSITKAAPRCDLQSMQQCQRASHWVNQITDAGCLT
ncbi:MAG TPA: hypothetical protein VHD32_09265 [Candidatus Didemnitutus sp.]|nr:hypothetical protein [Candidatus Didemnitutus sp.]